MQPPIRFLASCCCAIVLALGAVDSTTTAGSGRAASWTASPSLVWAYDWPTLGQSVERFTLWIGGVDGSRPRPLLQGRTLLEGRNPRISPDGRWIAHSREEHTYLVSSEGGRPWLVARNARPVRWSRTSRYLATAGQGALYVTDVETRLRATIDREATILGASISPSGKEIVWGRKRGQGPVVEGGVDLFRARVDGSQRIRLTRGGRSSNPVWGKRRIAFARVRSSGDPVFPVYELWTMRPSGKGLQRVTRTSHGPVEWSADGRRVLTSTYNKSGSVLSMVDIQTGSIRPVIRGQFVLPLSLSKDGRWILAWALNPLTKPQGDLVRVGWDGRRTTLVKDADQRADWNL